MLLMPGIHVELEELDVVLDGLRLELLVAALVLTRVRCHRHLVVGLSQNNCAINEVFRPSTKDKYA